MAMYSLPELEKRWRRKDMTVEQMIGQLLQHLIVQEKRLDDLSRQSSKRD